MDQTRQIAALERPAAGRSVRARFAAPASVGIARLRARPGRGVLLGLGVAGATMMLIAVAGGAIVAKDRAVRSALASLPASDRSFRVDAFELPPGQSYAQANRRVRRVLSGLTPAQPIAGTFYRQLEIGNGLVQLESLAGLGSQVRLVSGRLPRECVPARCEVLQVGPGSRGSWRQSGIDLVRVGIAKVPDAALFGPWLAPGSQATRLLAAGADAFARLPALDGFYHDSSWIDPVAPGQIHVWSIGAVLARESRAQDALGQAGAEYELSGPDSALMAAQSTAHVAGQRLDLVGGEISVLLLGFALVAAVGLRRGLAGERSRLVQRGATAPQVLVSVVSEIGATTLAGGVAGAIGGVLVDAILARRTGLPWQAVLRHGPGTASAIALVLLLWLVATVALVVVATRRPAEKRGGVRVLDVVALAAAGAAAIGFARGGLDASTLATGSDAVFLLLLPALVCVVAAIAVARLLGPLMRTAERLARRSRPAVRLAMLGLARAPARTAATASFLVVAIGLALFATAYGKTLQRGAGDQAAFAAPLDFALTEGPRLVLPLEAAPLRRYDAIAPGVHAYPVVRQTAEVPGSGTNVLSPTVLGLAPGALAGLHWRSDFASASLSSLVGRVEADPQAALRGLPLPAGSTLSLAARVRGAGVDLDLAAEDATGDVHLLPLAERGPSRYVTRTPAGRRLELVGLEISVVAADATALAHRAAEGVEATVPRGSVVLGPLRSDARTLTDWRGWVAPGATLDTRSAVHVSYVFTTGQTIVVRRRQATDGHPLLVIASPSVASAAGPGGTVVLDFGTGRVPARIVGVARRFPDAEQEGEGFVVADESRLAVALDASLPGTGRATELWLAAPPAELPRVGRALERPPFAALVVASRSALRRSLASDALARGVTWTLAAAAVVALALAVLALWLALLGELGDERGELFDLEAQGVGPATLRRQFRVRAAVLTLTAVVGGAALGLILSRLVVALVRLSATGTTPVPPLLYQPAWALDAAGLAALVVAVAAAVELATRRAFRGDEPGRASWSLE